MASKRSVENDDKEEPEAKKGFWAMGLVQAIKDPESIVEEDDQVVVIKDKYPKAEHHFLVLPKEEITNINKLKRDHVPLLQHMQSVGEKVAKRYPRYSFRLGYHSIASMFRLHLHVISDDFVSPALKYKKHWNSFHTSFFIPSEDLIAFVEKNGYAKQITQQKAKELMNTPLKCHKCSEKLKDIPKLKEHLLTHISKDEK